MEIFLFAFEVVRVDVAAIIVMVILGLSGIVPADRIFDGFSSNAVISIIAVMIIGAGLDRTGVMSRLAAFILRVGGSTADFMCAGEFMTILFLVVMLTVVNLVI